MKAFPDVEVQCAMCNQSITVSALHGMAGCVNICPSCRDDAALGAAVRGMPAGSRMRHGKQGNWWVIVGMADEAHHGTTPEEALRKAGLME